MERDAAPRRGHTALQRAVRIGASAILALAAPAGSLGATPEVSGPPAAPSDGVAEAARAVEAPLPEEVDALPVVRHGEDGPLAGLVVYLSAAHGWVAHETGRGWQRPEENGIVEDVWTARFATEHLIPALERHGAVVLTPRERDPHAAAVVVGDADEGFAAEGAIWRERAARPASCGGNAVAVPAEATLLGPGGEARWTLAAPEDGRWQLYASWLEGSDRDPHAEYTVLHPGGADLYPVDQRLHGSTWWPIGAYDLHAGDRVEVLLRGSGEGTLSADAVRLGGGTLSVHYAKKDEWTTMPAYDFAAVHLLEAQGAPDWIWAVPGGGLGGDASARARWADWAHPDGEEAIYLSVHTDAGGGTGTSAYIRQRCWDPSCPERVRSSEALADFVRSEIVGDIRREYEPAWVDRGTFQASLAEVSDELNPEVPSALFEIAYHDNARDARLLADGVFARLVAEAVARGVIRWRGGAVEAAEPLD